MGQVLDGTVFHGTGFDRATRSGPVQWRGAPAGGLPEQAHAPGAEPDSRLESNEHSWIRAVAAMYEASSGEVKGTAALC